MKRLVLIALLAVFAFALGAPSQSADAAPVAVISGITAENCSIFVEVYAYAPGYFTVRLYDDGDLLGAVGIDASQADAYYTVQFNLGALGQESEGVGILLFDSSNLNDYIDYVDPYVPDLPEHCAAGTDQVAIPSSAVGGTLVKTADLYWGPDADKITKPLVTLAVGKSVLVVGPDETGEFYKIIFAGKSLWIRAETLGPNFDKVWNGQPLPTNAVK